MVIQDKTIATRIDLAALLSINKTVVILKFGAKWCGPCKFIAKNVNEYMRLMPADITCILVDIDESIDLYSYLKTKKVVNGVPVMLAYYAGNINSCAPDEVVIGTNMKEIHNFFVKCVTKYNLSI
jgi:thiol-disulfide isomerase/thioredoxin